MMLIDQFYYLIAAIKSQRREDDRTYSKAKQSKERIENCAVGNIGYNFFQCFLRCIFLSNGIHHDKTDYCCSKYKNNFKYARNCSSIHAKKISQNYTDKRCQWKRRNEKNT